MRLQPLLAVAASLSLTAVQATAVAQNKLVKRGPEPAYVGVAPGTYTYIGCYVHNATVFAPDAVPGKFEYEQADLDNCAASCYGHDNGNDGTIWTYFSVQGQAVSASSAIMLRTLNTDMS